MKNPHILFVIMHDFGRRYGCYDDPAALTPNLDRLAAAGTQFKNHFCNYPLCGPARANLFTGYRPETTRRFNNQPFFSAFRERMGSDFKTLPEWFKKHGYRSLGAGFVYHDKPDIPSWSEPFSPQTLPGDLPAWSIPYQQACPNIYRNDESLGLIQERIRMLRAEGQDDEYIHSLDGLRRCRGPAVEAGECGDEGYYDGVATTTACEWIQAHDPQAPLFCAVGYSATHLPFNVPRQYWDLYDRDQLRLASFRKPPAGSPEWSNGDSEPVQYYTTTGYSKAWMASDEESLELKHGHYAAISYVDAQIGRLLDSLSAKGMLDSTLVVVTSDHGFHDSEHGYWGKHNCRDFSFRIPLLMKIPGAASATYTGLSEHTDIYPTLCTVAGLPTPDFLTGADLGRNLESGTVRGREAVFAMRKPMWHDRLQKYDQCRSVRIERYRLNTYYDEAGTALYRELFDYEEDPEERQNHADKHPQLIEELEALYLSEVPFQ